MTAGRQLHGDLHACVCSLNETRGQALHGMRRWIKQEGRDPGEVVVREAGCSQKHVLTGVNGSTVVIPEDRAGRMHALNVRFCLAFSAYRICSVRVVLLLVLPNFKI